VGDATAVYPSSSEAHFACSEKGAICAVGTQLWFPRQVWGGGLVRDLSSGNVLFELAKPISNLAMSADGTVLAIASPPPAGDKTAAGEITLREIPSGVVRQTLSELPDPTRVGPGLTYPRGLALSSDGKLLASAGEGGAIRIRDTNTGNE